MPMSTDQILDWIETQHTHMLDEVIAWSNINTYTLNFGGINALSEKITQSFSIFDEKIYHLELPTYRHINFRGEMSEAKLAPVIILKKRPHAQRQGLFVLHLDTPYPPHDSLQEAFLIEGKILRGQGVSDSKGGIAVLLKALEAFEKSEHAHKVGWTVVMNTDEKIGSPNSAKILEQHAKRSDLGFVFDPCLPDGKLISKRKGSGHFTLVARRKNSNSKTNTIALIAQCINDIQSLTHAHPGIDINIGIVQGGSSMDNLPNVALTKFVVKISTREEQFLIENKLDEIIQKYSDKDNVSLELYGEFLLPPKMLDIQTLDLYSKVQDCGEELGLNLDWMESSNYCDANRLSAYGLPTIDTLGVQGGQFDENIEFMYIHSLKDRAKLAALVLIKWASGNWRLI